MKVADFDFALPPELIAQEPIAERAQARLLHVGRVDGALSHRQVSALPALLRAGDVVVVNSSKVFPARLLGKRVPTGGAVECLLVGRIDGDAGSDARALPAGNDETWEALMHPGQKLGEGAHVVFEGAGPSLHGEVLARRYYGRRVIRLWTSDAGTSVESVVDAIGHVPLPPYVRRPDRQADRDRYQTVFAASRGSVAAPTAGLHFSEDLLASLRSGGVDVVDVTLHVGYGTFQPVRVDDVESHRLEPERYVIGDRAATVINGALDDGRRVIAVGTTTTRTLEAVAREHGGRVQAGRGATDLFIYPGFDFQVVSGLVTNFHLPRSSLLMLVAAFAGRARVLAAYEEAVRTGYRFYSYGDAMAIL